jgi:putative endonuclease
MMNNDWIVYLIRCSDGSLYCGITNHIVKRLKAHNSGKGAKYTRTRRPVALEAVSHKMTKSDALKFEYHLKQVPARDKIHELTTQEAKMAADLKKQVQQVSKEVKALSKKVDKLVAAAGKTAKPKKAAAKKAAPKKAAAKKTVAKKAPAKKAAAKKKVAKKKAPAKKTAAKKTGAKKKAPAKKAAKVTAADAILKVVNRTKKGINTADLMKKTGFDNKKVANIIFKLKKQGKIKNPEKGIYVKA